MNKGKPTKIGRLVILERDHSRQGRFRYFWCLCDCGNKVSRLISDLRRGRSLSSCGCYASELKYADKGQAAFRGAYLRYKNKAARKDIPFSISVKQFIEIISMQCYYCGIEPKDYNPYLDSKGKSITPSHRQTTIDRAWVKMNGVDKKDRKGGYIVENCLPCCFPCNRAKGDMSYDEYIQYLERIAQFRLHSNGLN